MGKKERMALFSLLSVVVAGHVIRAVALHPSAAPGSLALVREVGSGDIVAHRARSARAGKPLAKGETIDLNRARATEIARIPGVGPALAEKLVAERERLGGFASFGELDRVPGVGPSMLGKLKSVATLADTVMLQARRPAAELPPMMARRPVASVDPSQVLDLNVATAKDLDALPGIGSKRATAIVRYRSQNGPFGSLEQLYLVPGLRRSVVSRIIPYLRI